MKGLTAYHWTHRKNLESIFRLGLDPSFHQTELPRVYLCRPDLRQWAQIHTVERHRWDPHELVCFKADVPKGVLTPIGGQGIYYSDKVVPVGSLVSVVFNWTQETHDVATLLKKYWLKR